MSWVKMKPSLSEIEINLFTVKLQPGYITYKYTL